MKNLITPLHIIWTRADNFVMRKVYTTIVVKVVMTLNDEVEVADVIGEMDYQFNISEDQGFIEDTEITDFEVDDSK